MKKILFTLTLAILFQNVVLSQKVEVYAELNYNTFSHSKLKDFQLHQIKSLETLPISVDDNFPSNYGFTIGCKFMKNISAFVSYTTTGGKISYADYSGKIRLKQPIEQIAIGGIYSFPLLKESENLRLGIKGFLSFTSLEIESYTKILQEVEESNIKLNSTDYGLGPILIYELPVWVCKLRFSVAYDVMISGKLLFKEDNDFHLENSSGEDVKADWSGLKAGIGISIPI